MAFKVAERTLSPEVSKLFEGFLGCKIASEGILPERKQFDFFLILDGSQNLTFIAAYQTSSYNNGGLENTDLSIYCLPIGYD